jgi:hypothetical protein
MPSCVDQPGYGTSEKNVAEYCSRPNSLIAFSKNLGTETKCVTDLHGSESSKAKMKFIPENCNNY